MLLLTWLLANNCIRPQWVQGRAPATSLKKQPIPAFLSLYAAGCWLAARFLRPVTGLRCQHSCEVFEHQIGEHPDFPRRVPSRRADDINASLRQCVARHDGHQRTRSSIVFCDEIRKRCYPKSGCCRRRERDTVIRLEASLRVDGDRLVAVDKLPGLSPLHKGLVSQEFVGCGAPCLSM
jgi:hypothetical protein